MWDRRLMRSAIACFAAVLLTNCSPTSPKIDTIEIQKSGDIAFKVIVHENGAGEFEGSPILPEKGNRTFTLKPGQFERLASTLRPYMSYARPVTDASLRDVIYGNWPKCQHPRSYTTDVGALYLRWKGPKTDIHYLIDFGCDFDANRVRNQQLMNAVHQLPIHQYLGVFG